ncbi:MAG: homoserine dehydrogenase [Thermoleophilia bacterium]|nr:homoserine dehydrogenase [Thermoleophilia bacterium]
MNPIRIGLLGIGTVGGGTWEVITRNAEEISRRVGRPLTITRIADLDTVRARELSGGAADVTDDARSVTRDPDIDIVVELIGGYGIARELVLDAIAHGKHVVTANKALLATHGEEIFAASHQNGVVVAFEAAVGGGIPIIKALREGLVANRIEWIAGIINGTTNFILSEMRDRGVDFPSALADAQANGYAEADPTFDIEGIDAAHKITLMAAMAFGIPVQFDACYVEGVTRVEQTDIRYAEKLGYRLKLLGITRRREHGVELRVHPCLVPTTRLIANVEGVMNAVLVQGDAVGPTLYYGAGAGSEPTASAVIADLVDVARLITADPGHRVPSLAFQPEHVSADLPVLPMDDVVTSYYLRLCLADRPGVLADVTRILADERVSIESALQQEPGAEEDRASIVLLTHPTTERAIQAAIARIQALPTSYADVVLIRMEKLS